MITESQLSILQDIFENCDGEWLMSHISVKDGGHRNVTVKFDNINSQDYTELLGMQ